MDEMSDNEDQGEKLTNQVAVLRLLRCCY